MTDRPNQEPTQAAQPTQQQSNQQQPAQMQQPDQTPQPVQQQPVQVQQTAQQQPVQAPQPTQAAQLNQQQPVQSQPAQQAPGTSGLAIAGMVLGILAALASFIPIINNGAFVIGIIGLVLSGIGLAKTSQGKSKGRGIAIAGVVLCIISLAVTLMVQAACSAALDSISTTQSASSAAASTENSASSAAVESSSNASQSSNPTLGSTFSFDGMSITLGEALATTTISNQFSDYNGATVIALPVSITNNNADTHSLNMFAVSAYGSKGTELDAVYTYFDDDVRMIGDMRPGATQTGNLYFLYDGNGDYYLDFGFYKADVEAKIPVAL